MAENHAVNDVWTSFKATDANTGFFAILRRGQLAKLHGSTRGFGELHSTTEGCGTNKCGCYGGSRDDSMLLMFVCTHVMSEKRRESPKDMTDTHLFRYETHSRKKRSSDAKPQNKAAPRADACITSKCF